jgi:uncharacterized protein YjiS (DUF1127 family)
MRKYDEYLATIDTMYPDSYERQATFPVEGDLLQPAKMPVRAGLIAGLFDILGNWQARRRGRQILRDMGDEQLLDIGVMRICATREAARSWFLA